MKTFIYLDWSRLRKEPSARQDVENFLSRTGIHIERKTLQYIENYSPLGVENWEKTILGESLTWMKKGDYFIIYKLSQLGKNVMETLEILSELYSNNIRLFIAKDELPFSFEVATDSAAFYLYPFLSSLFLKLAVNERQLKSDRAMKALETKKKNGLTLGRPKGVSYSFLDSHKEKIIKMLDQGVTQKYIAKEFKISQAGLSYWLGKRSLRRKR